MQDLSNYIGDLNEEIGGTLLSFKSAMAQFKSMVMADFFNTVNKVLDLVMSTI